MREREEVRSRGGADVELIRAYIYQCRSVYRSVLINLYMVANGQDLNLSRRKLLEKRVFIKILELTKEIIAGLFQDRKERKSRGQILWKSSN